jgi:hypothetical protein
MTDQAVLWGEALPRALLVHRATFTMEGVTVTPQASPRRLLSFPGSCVGPVGKLLSTATTLALAG